jgi:hypothetical protein
MSTEKNQQSGQEQKGYNPFIANVNEKAYTQMNVNVSGSQMSSAIPEPTFAANVVSANEDPYKMLNSDFGSAMGEMNGSTPSAGDMSQLSDEDKKQSAEQLAKVVVDGYAELKNLANYLLLIDQKKVKKMEAEGEIDTSLPITLRGGQTVTIGQFIEEYNEQAKGTITTTKEFKKEVTPPLTRIFMKRGVGMSDEGLVGYAFANIGLYMMASK